ncbi:MAG TPA: hypothetical protein DCW68_03835 [Rhodospirillaceae bacterium]|nr:MAG: hypothetical protein A2018_07020 [Alphaproteobacteria bacterium GWF2_58_20]HAU29225.1 hypothetical protein [Rhodospirillaceae bacterium]
MADPRTPTGFWKNAKKVLIGVGLILGMAGTASAFDLGDIERYGKSRNKGQERERLAWKILKDGQRRAEQKRRDQKRKAEKVKREMEKVARERQKAVDLQVAANARGAQLDSFMHQADSAWVRYETSVSAALDNPDSDLARREAQKAASETQTQEKVFQNALTKAYEADAKAAEALIKTGGDPYAQQRIERKARQDALLEAREVSRQEAMQRLIEKEQRVNAEKAKASKKAHATSKANTKTESTVSKAEAAPSGSLTSTFKSVTGAFVRRKMGLPPKPIQIQILPAPGQK